MAHFVHESHGREVMDMLKPTNGKLIGRATLGDEEDTRRAIAAAKRAFATFGKTTKGRPCALFAPAAQGCLGPSGTILTAIAIEEPDGGAQFARLLVERRYRRFRSCGEGTP